MSLASADQDRSNAPPARIQDAIRAVLADDHEHLDRSFQAMITEASRGDAADLREEWRAFEHALLGHFETEETQILPAFCLEEPTEARALVEEHERIRGKVAELGIDLDFHCLPAERIRSLVDELRAHALREERVFYPWAVKRLGEVAREQNEAPGRLVPRT